MNKWSGLLALGLLVGTVAMAGQMVVVPDDYSLLELPEGTQVEMVNEIALRAGTTSEDLLFLTQKGNQSEQVLKCELMYEKAAQRRTIPAGTKLTVTFTSVSPIQQEAPAVTCFIENKYPAQPSQEHFVSVKSAGGFEAMIHCRDQMTWVSAVENQCDFSDMVTVEGVKSAMKFTADKDKLNGIIGAY